MTHGWRCPTCSYCEKCGKSESNAQDMLSCGECGVSVHKNCLTTTAAAAEKSHVSTNTNLPLVPWRCRACALCETCGKPEPSSSFTGHWGAGLVCSKCSSAVECRLCGKPYDEEELIIRCPVCEK